jgi:hypothetical protein
VVEDLARKILSMTFLAVRRLQFGHAGCFGILDGLAGALRLHGLCGPVADRGLGTFDVFSSPVEARR